MLRALFKFFGPQISVLPRTLSTSPNAEFLCRYYQVIQHLHAFLRIAELSYFHMETSGGHLPFSTQTSAPAKASLESSALNGMSSTSAHGDTLGIGDLALSTSPENNHKTYKRAFRRQKKRSATETTTPHFDAELVKQLAPRSRAGKDETFQSPSALRQAADAQRPVRQGRASELYGTDASVMRAAVIPSGANAEIARRANVNEAQIIPVEGPGVPAHGLTPDSNGAASVRLPPLRYDGSQGFVPLIAPTSVPVFRKVPP